MLLGMLGGIVGLCHYRQPYGILVGTAAGSLVGAVTLPISLIPVEWSASVLTAAIGGGAVLVCTGLLLRLNATENRELAGDLGWEEEEEEKTANGR